MNISPYDDEDSDESDIENPRPLGFGNHLSHLRASGLWGMMQKEMRKSETDSIKKHPLFELYMQRTNFVEIIESHFSRIMNSICIKQKISK